MYIHELVVSYRPRFAVGQTTNALVTTPQDAARVFISIIGDEPVEVFGMFCLTTKRRLIAYREVSRGGIDWTAVNPREVFQAALLSHASAIVVGHNHPSGDPTPSPEDHQITHRLSAAGALIGVAVLDHVIVGHEGRYFSFTEKGEQTCR